MSATKRQDVERRERVQQIAIHASHGFANLVGTLSKFLFVSLFSS